MLGEHVDYCGYGVLPCSIELDVLMAGAVEDAPSGSPSTVDLRNVNSERYPDERFTFEGDASALAIDDSALLWHNYIRAGLKGVLAHLGRDSKPRALSLRVTCDGTVPAGGGLSSSSAMTACAAIATMHAYGETANISRREVTNVRSTSADSALMRQIAIESERLVGVNSGGMDQTASIYGQRGHLLNVCVRCRLVSAEPAASLCPSSQRRRSSCRRT